MRDVVILSLVAFVAYGCGLLIKDTIESYARERRRDKDRRPPRRTKEWV